jgi:hypothetical protein
MTALIATMAIRCRSLTNLSHRAGGTQAAAISALALVRFREGSMSAWVESGLQGLGLKRERPASPFHPMAEVPNRRAITRYEEFYGY